MTTDSQLISCDDSQEPTVNQRRPSVANHSNEQQEWNIVQCGPYVYTVLYLAGRVSEELLEVRTAGRENQLNRYMIHYTIYIIHNTLYITHYTLYIINYTLCVHGN